MHIRHLIILLFLTGNYQVLTGQFDRTQQDANDIYTDESSDSIPLQIQRASQDTSIFKYAYAEDLTDWNYYSDTLLSLFHQYDPARNGNVDYYTLGHTGGSVLPMAYTVRENLGYDNGLHQYDLYFKSIENFKYFDTNKPLNHLFFSPLDGQQNFLVKALFSREFSDGISFHLDYSRIKQNGFYSSQENKSTNLGTALRYLSRNNKYQLLANYFSNNFSERFNGGIVDPSDLEEPLFSERTNVPTQLLNAETRFQNREFRVQHYIKLLPKGAWDLDLQINNIYLNRYYRFSDDISSDDEITYYEGIVNDDRGIRNILNEKVYQNTGIVKLSAQSYLQLNFGLDHQFISYDQEAGNEKLNNIFLLAGLNTRVKEYISLQSDAKLGTLDASGDFSIDTKAKLKYKNWLDIKGRLFLYRYTPSLVQRSLTINQSSIFAQSLDKPFGSKLEIGLRVPKSGSSLILRQTVEDNSIYFEKGSIAPKQLNGQLTTLQVELQQSLRWWLIGYDGSLLYQTFNEDIYHLPPLVTKQSLYLNSNIFDKKMNLQIGADFRYIHFDNAVDFFPVNGQLYASENEMDDLLALDFFVNFKIQDFRFFVKAENALDIFSESKNYTVFNYPDYDWKIRLGVSWLLSN